MEKTHAKLNVGSYFTLKNYRCKVTKVDSFSGTLHYGFVTIAEYGFTGRDNEGKPRAGLIACDNLFAGWIPCEFVGQCEVSE